MSIICKFTRKMSSHNWKKPNVNKMLQLLCIINTKDLFNIGKYYFKATKNKKCLAFNITNAYNCTFLYINFIFKFSVQIIRYVYFFYVWAISCICIVLWSDVLFIVCIYNYNHWSCEFESRCVLDTPLCDKVCRWLATGW